MKVSVEIPDETASEINNWIDTRLNTGPTKKMSHGPLDLGRLTQLLLEEVARTVSIQILIFLSRLIVSITATSPRFFDFRVQECSLV